MATYVAIMLFAADIVGSIHATPLLERVELEPSEPVLFIENKLVVVVEDGHRLATLLNGVQPIGHLLNVVELMKIITHSDIS